VFTPQPYPPSSPSTRVELNVTPGQAHKRSCQIRRDLVSARARETSRTRALTSRRTKNGVLGTHRLGQVHDRAGPLELFDHETPARARLDREGHLPAVEPAQPQPQMLPIRGCDATAADLAAFGVQLVERDLPTMKIQTTNDRHDQPPNEDDSDPAIVHQPPDCRLHMPSS
jgi:hypothetical protein